MNANKAQSVHLRLADGRLLLYTGPAQVQDTEITDVKVIEVAISRAIDLEPGTYFELATLILSK